MKKNMLKRGMDYKYLNYRTTLKEPLKPARILLHTQHYIRLVQNGLKTKEEILMYDAKGKNPPKKRICNVLKKNFEQRL